MDESGGSRTHPDALGRALERASEAFALIGGAIFVGIAIMSVASIASRWLFNKPLSGDYELVQAGCAVFVAMCLPIAQMRGANIIVDFFTTRASPSTQRKLDAVGALLLGVVMLLLFWRLSAGTISMREAGETSTILGWPTWTTYALMLPGVALTAAAGFYTAWRRMKESR
ncbi:MAG TPA: TRAP transporter small permease [Casimicrobiaceae bacterium]|nr:TRAP transporter small permease [Casimicrobiaceae bacterium]